MLLDGLDLRGGQPALQQIHLRRADERTGAAGNELHALRSGIGALVKLAGQILGGENRAVGLRQTFQHVVDLRLGEHGGDTLFQHVRRHALYVVAVDDAHVFDLRDAEKITDFRTQRARLVGVGGLTLYKNSVDHKSRPSFLLQCFLSDVPAAVRVLKMHPVRRRIGAFHGLL